MRLSDSGIPPTIEGMNSPRFAVIMLMLCLFSPFLTAQSGISPRLTTYLHTIATAEQPRVIEDYLVLTYTASHPVRYVAAAFAHEEFSALHIYRKNQYGIFVLSIPLPKEENELRYRIIVDGLWMSDPRNPERISDPRGIPISRYRLPQRTPQRGETPLMHSDGSVEFVYFGAAGRRVGLEGDFNHWSPFSHPMREIAPGEYRIRLRLYEGMHRYRFDVNGENISDPLNPRIAYDVLGNQVSAVTVKTDGVSIAERM